MHTTNQLTWTIEHNTRTQGTSGIICIIINNKLILNHEPFSAISISIKYPLVDNLKLTEMLYSYTEQSRDKSTFEINCATTPTGFDNAFETQWAIVSRGHCSKPAAKILDSVSDKQ